MVDHFGDIGVCWRLALELQGAGHRVRLFCDDLNSLLALAPDYAQSEIQVLDWTWENAQPRKLDLLIESFACGVPDSYWHLQKGEEAPLWIVLDYLALESWAGSCHGLRSPSPIAGVSKYYFFPGLGDDLGGLIADRGYRQQIQERDLHRESQRQDWALAYDVRADSAWISLFTYPHDWVSFFTELEELEQSFVLWVPAGYVLDWCSSKLPGLSFAWQGDHWQKAKVRVQPLPFMKQEKYQHLLLLCDFAFVRGEDSFIRAVLGGVPHLWHAYLQAEGAHMDKVDGYLNCLRPFLDENFELYAASLRALNQRESVENLIPVDLQFKQLWQKSPALSASFKNLSQHALQQWDLTSKLTNFVHEHLANSAQTQR